MIKEGDLITFKTNSFQESETYKGTVMYKKQLGFIVTTEKGVQYELKKLLDVRKANLSQTKAKPPTEANCTYVKNGILYSSYNGRKVGRLSK